MQNLKKFFIIVILTLSLLFLFLIKFNFFDIRYLKNNVFSSRNELINFKVTHLEMSVELEKMKNNFLTNNTESINDFNANKYLNNLNNNTKKLNNIKSSFDNFKKNYILKNYNTFRESRVYLYYIEYYYNKINNSFKNNSIEDTNFYHNMALNYIIKFNDSFGKEINNLISLYIAINNFTMISIVISICVLILLLIIRSNKNLKLISSYFKKNNNFSKFKPKFKEEKLLKKILDKEILKNQFLKKVKKIANRGYLLAEVLEDLFMAIEKELGIDRIGVAFIDYNNKEIIAEYSYANYDNILLTSDFKVSFNETSLTSLINNPSTIISNNLNKNIKNNPNSKSINLLLKEGIQSNIVFPLLIDNDVYGFLFLSSKNKNHFNKKIADLGENISYDISGLINKTYLTKTIFSKITIAFADLVEEKDNETGEHLDRMIAYSKFITQLLIDNPNKNYNANNKFLREIIDYAGIHDIGKVGIPDKILKKPGKLNDEEWEIMKTHPNIGADIFSDLKRSLEIFNQDFYKIAENIARYHHEKWDGSGYPKGLSKEKIPLEARIVSIADVFDALTSERVYKKAFSFEKSMSILKKDSGKHFDPYLINLLEKNKDSFNSLYEKLNKFS